MRLLIASLLLVFLTLTACPKPSGQCQYGETDPYFQSLTLTQVETYSDKSQVLLFDSGDRVVISNEDYERCKEELHPGASIELQVQDGGPCPPLRRLSCAIQ